MRDRRALRVYAHTRTRQRSCRALRKLPAERSGAGSKRGARAEADATRTGTGHKGAPRARRLGGRRPVQPSTRRGTKGARQRPRQLGRGRGTGRAPRSPHTSKVTFVNTQGGWVPPRDRASGRLGGCRGDFTGWSAKIALPYYFTGGGCSTTAPEGLQRYTRRAYFCIFVYNCIGESTSRFAIVYTVVVYNCKGAAELPKVKAAGA